jgi:hypothetical protein
LCNEFSARKPGSLSFFIFHKMLFQNLNITIPAMELNQAEGHKASQMHRIDQSFNT